MRKRWMSCLPLTLSMLAIDVGAQIVSVPPAFYQPGPLLKANVAQTLLSPAGTAYTIVLPTASAAEAKGMQTSTAAALPLAAGGKGRPLQIGFSRALPDGARPLYMSAMPWQALADGGRATRIVVTSPGAAAIRLALSMTRADPDVSLRFTELAGMQKVYGPYPANIAATGKPYWSPVLEGDTAIMEVYLPSGVSAESLQLAMPQISHLVRAGSALKAVEPVSDIGLSGRCEVDVACVATPAALNQARAVAKMIFTESGDTFACTGTLLNDSIASNTPYFFSASHCMDSQEAAGTLFTYWFFDAPACGNHTTIPAYQTVAGGAMLLGRSVDNDWALVRLNAPPPANAVFSAWRAEPLAASMPISVVHHPEGDLKKFSMGTMLGYFSFSDGPSFSSARYTQGSTEPGSSGAGLLTLGSGGGFYELRGGLFSGTADCSNTSPNSGTDSYSRLDLALPLVSQYLTPDAPNPARKTIVVEYYHAGLDDYFITAGKAEMNDLDTGVHPGWVRTGLTFLAYTDPALAPPDASPVCRFYVLPAVGDSHFYSADPAECAATTVKFASSWGLESSAVFYIQLPNRITGACAANTRPIYRFLNKTNQIHHRYTAEVDVRDCLYHGYHGNNPTGNKEIDCSFNSSTWIEEGYGAPPAAPVMCGPAS